PLPRLDGRPHPGAVPAPRRAPRRRRRSGVARRRRRPRAAPAAPRPPGVRQREGPDLPGAPGQAVRDPPGGLGGGGGAVLRRPEALGGRHRLARGAGRGAGLQEAEEGRGQGQGRLMPRPLSERFERSGVGRVLLSLLVVLVVGLEVATHLPPSALQRAVREPAGTAVRLLGIEHSWGVFAPDPRSTSLRLEARVTFADGTTTSWTI